MLGVREEAAGLNDSNVKQAGGDICQHSGGEELQTCCTLQVVEGEMEEG